MAALLDVWIAKPGSACLVDDHEWLVRVFDAHGTIFQWAGTVYADLPAPHAHWAGTIPPGTYVIQAVNTKTAETTDHAIVTAQCEGTVCVRLFVASKESSDCKITINEVIGIGQTVVTSVQVSGTAHNCKKIEVGITCGTGKTRTTTVTVSATGAWTATIPADNLRCICGKPIVVIAKCTEHPKCEDQLQTKLQCRSEVSSK